MESISSNNAKKSWSETAEWHPLKSRARSPSTQMLLEMKVGEVKRIYHYDTKCHGCHGRRKSGGKACSLQIAMVRYSKKGISFSSYHEDNHIAVVKRLT